MVDYNEAIKNLQTIHGMPLTIRMAIEALEKQIPNKPIAVTNMDGEDTYECPSCRATLMFRFQRATFASLHHHCICGQAIDWSDE